MRREEITVKCRCNRVHYIKGERGVELDNLDRYRERKGGPVMHVGFSCECGEVKVAGTVEELERRAKGIVW